MKIAARPTLLSRKWRRANHGRMTPALVGLHMWQGLIDGRRCAKATARTALCVPNAPAQCALEIIAIALGEP